MHLTQTQFLRIEHYKARKDERINYVDIENNKIYCLDKNNKLIIFKKYGNKLYLIQVEKQETYEYVVNIDEQGNIMTKYNNWFGVISHYALIAYEDDNYCIMHHYTSTNNLSKTLWFNRISTPGLIQLINMLPNGNMQYITKSGILVKRENFSKHYELSIDVKDIPPLNIKEESEEYLDNEKMKKFTDYKCLDIDQIMVEHY